MRWQFGGFASGTVGFIRNSFGPSVLPDCTQDAGRKDGNMVGDDAVRGFLSAGLVFERGKMLHAARIPVLGKCLLFATLSREFQPAATMQSCSVPCRKLVYT
jgi:hypothetical protein